MCIHNDEKIKKRERVFVSVILSSAVRLLSQELFYILMLFLPHGLRY